MGNYFFRLLLERPLRLGYLLVLVAFLLYANSLGNQYALDDHLVVNDLTQKGISSLPKILRSKYLTHPEIGMERGYRPVTLVSFAIEASIVGKNVFFSHFINILLYGLTGVLLFVVLMRLWEGLPEWSHITCTDATLTSPNIGDKDKNALLASRLAAFLAALLFLAHPLHTEVTASIKSRDELLAFGFAMLAFWCLLKACEQDKQKFLLWTLCALVLFGLGMFAKTTIFPLVVALPLCLYMSKKWRFSQVLALLAILPLFYVVQKLMSKGVGTKELKGYSVYIENPMEALDFVRRLPVAAGILWKYLQLHLFPHPLRYYYGFDQIPMYTWANWQTWAGLLLHLALLGVAFFKRRTHLVLSIGIVYYLVNVVVFTNLVKLAPGIVAERFVYCTSLGFCIVLAYLWTRYGFCPAASTATPAKGVGTKWALPLLLLVLGLYSFKTISRNPDWHDLPTLTKNDMPNLDRSAKANLLYADGLAKMMTRKTQVSQQSLDAIEKHYLRSTEIYDQYHTTWNNLGHFYMKINQFQKAIGALRNAAKLKPESVEIKYNLAISLLKANRVGEGIRLLQEITEQAPKSQIAVPAFAALHDYYQSENATIDLMQNLQRAIDAHPEEPAFQKELDKQNAKQAQ